MFQWGASISTVLIDSGVRPEECFPAQVGVRQLDQRTVRYSSGSHGKTPSARRNLKVGTGEP